eukprot:365043-Chlamydomonas_euryale.AAC.12
MAAVHTYPWRRWERCEVNGVWRVGRIRSPQRNGTTTAYCQRWRQLLYCRTSCLLRKERSQVHFKLQKFCLRSTSIEQLASGLIHGHWSVALSFQSWQICYAHHFEPVD